MHSAVTPHRHAIVIAGPASGVGKTTIALGLMAAFRRRGLAVQPFKCGPDFIDAGHHTRVCDRPSRNLDGWMLSGETNRALFTQHASTADIAIVEGMMGLFCRSCSWWMPQKWRPALQRWCAVSRPLIP